MLMANFRIIKLKPEEWKLYQRIRLEALLMEPQAFSSQYAEVVQRPDFHWQERLIEAQAGKKSWLLFAKQNGQLIGMIGASCSEASNVVEIISVYVTRKKRGQGIATALMAAILEEVRKAGIFRKAVLTVNADQAAAVALYRHFGFRIVGEKTGVMGDGVSYLGYLMEMEFG
jgi:ribosomal protein S18 acetylase RimI-like enzyme